MGYEVSEPFTGECIENFVSPNPTQKAYLESINEAVQENSVLQEKHDEAVKEKSALQKKNDEAVKVNDRLVGKNNELSGILEKHLEQTQPMIDQLKEQASRIIWQEQALTAKDKEIATLRAQVKQSNNEAVERRVEFPQRLADLPHQKQGFFSSPPRERANTTNVSARDKIKSIGVLNVK